LAAEGMGVTQGWKLWVMPVGNGVELSREVRRESVVGDGLLIPTPDGPEVEPTRVFPPPWVMVERSRRNGPDGS
jgi:hypothetical protein